MSRIGKTPVPIPDKVTVDFDGLTVTVKGPKGELKRRMPEGVSFDKIDSIRGMDITIVTSARSDQEGKALLQELGMPFSKN